MTTALTSRPAFAAVLLLPLSVACSFSSTDDTGQAEADQTRDAAAGDASRTDASRDASADAPRDGAKPATGTFVDPRDEQSYPTTKIGAHTWLARNLNFAIAGSSFCYGDLAKNCDTYGRLYLWSVARTACPIGWHLGSDAEWQDLEAAVGMDDDDLELEGYATVRGTNEGTTLKSATGFGARPAGFRTGTTSEALGDRTYFWTSTTRGADVWRRRIAATEPTVFRFTNPPTGFAISVRCVAD